MESLDAPRSPSGLPARRKLDYLTWTLVALALGWLAQGLFAREHLIEGLLLYAIAIPLFTLQITRSEGRRTTTSIGLHISAKSMLSLTCRRWHKKVKIAHAVRGWTGISLTLAALILSFSSLGLFTLETQNGIAWSLYVVSLLLFVVGIWLLDPEERDRGNEKQEKGNGESGNLRSEKPVLGGRLGYPSRTFVFSLLLIIILLALFFRLFHFSSLPFGTWFDEAEAGIQARRILQDPTFRPVFWEAINLPAPLLYLFVFSFRLFGVSTPALRVISVLFGLGAVLFAYLFGRELGGRRWGLLLAFLVATMRWHVNFSRIAMTGIDTPFFEFAVLYFGLRASRSSRLQAIAWTGVFLGLGLSFYGAFRLFLLALILFVLGWILVTRIKGLRAAAPSDQSSLLSRQVALRLGLLLVATWLAAMPVAQFAWRHSEVFWLRTRTVSVLENRDEPNLARALLQNTKKHLLMFNYRGDNNGRHNLPGAPMLDRLTAVLFAMGLGLAIARRDFASMFFLLLLALGLAGGIFTLDFEAPQALRSIAALPAVVYFIALSLDAIWLEFKWGAQITQPRYSLILVAIGLGVIAVSNGAIYFGRQANDHAVWRAFSTAETLVGKKMSELGPDPIYYLSPVFTDHPSIRFHALSPNLVSPEESYPQGDSTGAQEEESPPGVGKALPLPDPLPAREPPSRPVVYFIHPDESWVFDLGRQVYLSGSFETLPGDSEFPPDVFFIQLEPDEVASVQGLDVRYWAGDDWEAKGVPVTTGRSPVVDMTWTDEVPFNPPFVAEWSGVLYAPEHGRYMLTVDAPGQVALALDDEIIEGTGPISVTPLLARGNHGLRLRAAGGEGRVRLTWRTPAGDEGTVPQWALYSFPVSGHGLLGRYYANPNWQGEPVMERIDPVLNVYFHLTPLPRPYSVEWTGVLDVPYSGVYTLGLRSVDEARLYLDRQLVVEATTPNEYVENFVTLEPGTHNLRITYQDLTGRSRIHLYWTRPGGEKEIIPTQFLWPSPAAKALQGDVLSPTPPATSSWGGPFAEMALTWQATWGAPGDAEGQFLEPRDVAVVGDMVFVADTGNRRVQAFDKDGTLRGLWAGGQAPFEEPLALGVDSQDRLLILDSLAGWIYRFDAAGVSLDRFAGPSSQTFHPRGMTVLADDTVIVVDTGNSRLVFFGPSGNMSGRLGTLGSAPGQLSDPADIAVDGADTYFVAESRNQRIQRLDRWGNSLGEWSIPLSLAHDGPHLAWAPDGSLLVTAPAEGAVLRYAADGRLLNRWTEAGTAPLRQPVGIYVDATSSTLYVTDTATHQVYIFRIE